MPKSGLSVGTDMWRSALSVLGTEVMVARRVGVSVLNFRLATLRR